VNHCVFCEIVAGKRKEELLYEDEWVMAFRPLVENAPVHVMVIPKKHISNVMEIAEEDAQSILHIHKGIQQVAHKLGVAEDGFRVITNIGPHGQQEVYHMHYHVVGGRPLSWQM
jgi:histidine triad (HIT) family protein